MKIKEIRKKGKEDCLKLLLEKKKKLNDVCFSAEGSKSKNTKEAFNIKKDIARIKTVLKEESFKKEK